jgi:hypothetical protein
MVQFVVLMLFMPMSSLSIYQSHIELSPLGFEFNPRYRIECMIEKSFVSELIDCAYSCNQDPWCHAFDYDSYDGQCRLFEGDLTTGSMVASVSATSIVGIVTVFPALFIETHDQNCQMCEEDRYETCSPTTNKCQCRSQTFWFNSICSVQLLHNDTCSHIDACRSDLNLACTVYMSQQFNICSLSMYGMA